MIDLSTGLCRTVLDFKNSLSLFAEATICLLIHALREYTHFPSYLQLEFLVYKD